MKKFILSFFYLYSCLHVLSSTTAVAGEALEKDVGQGEYRDLAIAIDRDESMSDDTHSVFQVHVKNEKDQEVEFSKIALTFPEASGQTKFMEGSELLAHLQSRDAIPPPVSGTYDSGPWRSYNSRPYYYPYSWSHHHHHHHHSSRSYSNDSGKVLAGVLIAGLVVAGIAAIVKHNSQPKSEVTYLGDKDWNDFSRIRLLRKGVVTRWFVIEHPAGSKVSEVELELTDRKQDIRIFRSKLPVRPVDSEASKPLEAKCQYI